MKIFLHSLIVFIVCLSSCLEPFNPNVGGDNQEFLVVDGIITDQPGPYLVKITKSTSLQGGIDSVSVENIFIEDDLGNLESLYQVAPGIYQTSSLQGETNRSYRLNFDYGGELYQSQWEKIHESQAIDSIYYEMQTKETTDTNLDHIGVQFFVDSHGPEDAQRYFKYEWEETWKIGVFDQLEFEYLGNDQTGSFNLNLPRICWKNKNSNGILLATTKGLSKNQLSAYKLGFRPGNDDEERFSLRYSLLVKQYVLDENEYLFWKHLEESSEETGGLFDKQPAEVMGNMLNITSPHKPVLGYFSASGQTEKRIYITSADVWNKDFFVECAYKSVLKSDFEFLFEYEEALILEIKTGFFYFRDFHFENEKERSGSIVGALLAPSKCVDCTAKGGSVNKPAFWND